MQVHEHQGSSNFSPEKRQEGVTTQDVHLETTQQHQTHQITRLPEAYDFRAPEKIDAERLNNKFGKAADFIEKRIHALKKMANELFDGEDKFLDEESKMIERALVFIDENIQKFKELLDKETEVKVKLEANLGERVTDFQGAQVKYDEARAQIKEIEDAMKEQAAKLVTLNSQKAQAALEIEKVLVTLKKIKIREPRDLGNEPFKWFLAVIYNESQAKYEFENFKKEVFVKDKGSDFIERLKGFRAFGIGKEEVQQTTKLLAMEKEVAEKLNPKKKPQLGEAVTKCFDYIKIIDSINQIMDEMHKKEGDLEGAAKKVDLTGAELDKQHSRRNDAEASLNISIRAIQTFDVAQKLFIATAERCRQRQKEISEALPNLKKSGFHHKKTEGPVEIRGQEEETFGQPSHQEAHKKSQPKRVHATYESDVTELPPQQKEGCKCTIF